jgi:PAS domain S-box-containing protein
MTASKVMIVEDDIIQRKLLSTFLDKKRYQVVAETGYGEKAVELVDNHSPDIILMDIELDGELDGIETADIVRSQFKIPIIFLSTYSEKKLQRAKLAEPYGFLLKPYRERELNVTIELALTKARADANLKQAEESVKKHANFLDKTMDQSPFAMWIANVEGIVTRTNEALRETLNLRDEQIVGIYSVLEDNNLVKNGVMPQVKAVFAEHRQARFSLLWKGYETGNNDFSRANNLWIDVSMFPILDEAGKLMNVVCQWMDITEQKQAEEQVSKELAEKHLLLQEIHHRVKNNLSVVFSLLSMQAEQFDDPRTREAFRVSQNRIMAMATVHELIYSSDNLTRINLQEYLETVVTSLKQSYMQGAVEIEMKFESEHIEIDLEQATPLGLVVTELVTNAFKHGFPNSRPGRIEILTALSDDKTVLLEISDDGVGLPESFDWGSPESLGLRLVQGLVEQQLEGSLDVNSDGGTQFAIRFKLHSSD